MVLFLRREPHRFQLRISDYVRVRLHAHVGPVDYMRPLSFISSRHEEKDRHRAAERCSSSLLPAFLRPLRSWVSISFAFSVSSIFFSRALQTAGQLRTVEESKAKEDDALHAKVDFRYGCQHRKTVRHVPFLGRLLLDLVAVRQAVQVV